MNRIFTILLCFFSFGILLGQNVNTEFGKNRIQHHDDFDNWWMYETENFITYWYGKGRNIAHTVVQLAELDNAEIQGVLEHRFNDKIEIIVYLDLTDLKQSNLGSEEVFISNTGQTKILGNKMFVYFNGDHRDLRHKIREGIAGVYLESMLHGSNLQEIVQNAVLLNLPDWYKEGLISFLGREWGSDIDNELREIFNGPKSRRYSDFYRLAKDYPQIAGHSMWYFISVYYGKSTISNLLYLTRINRSLENGFLYVLGSSYDRVVEEWADFYKNKFAEEDRQLIAFNEKAELNLRNRRNSPVSQIALSPNGETLAYILNERGKSRLNIYDLKRDQKAMIFKSGIKNIIQETDYGYPLMAWHPTRDRLSIIYEKRDVIYLSEIDFQTNEQLIQSISPEYHRIYSFDYWSNDTLLLNASTDGFSDLYMYYPNSRQSDRITEDFFDDLEASVTSIGGKKGILFSSNRLDLEIEKMKLDSILPIENFDLFFLEWTKDEQILRNLTNSPESNDRQPNMISGENIVYLTNASGIWNRKLIKNAGSSQQSEQYLSNYNRNIILQSSVKGSNKIVEFAFTNDRNKLFLNELDENLSVKPFQIELPGNEPDQEEDESFILFQENASDIVEPDDKYLFQSEFEEPEGYVEPGEQKPEEQQEEKVEDVLSDIISLPKVKQYENLSYKPSELAEFLNVRAIASRLKFKLDYVNTTLDNSLLFTGLDSYSGTKRDYEQPPLGILLKANIKDLFEDYVFEGGARFPTSFNGSEYFIVFDNKKRKLDKRFALYRKVTTENIDAGLLSSDRNQYNIVIGQYQVRYPLDIYTSIRATGTIRNDRFIQLSTDNNSRTAPIQDDQRLGLQLQYVYDNSLEIDYNLLQGTRYKVWVEFVKKFDLNLFEKGEGITFNEGFMTVVGLDARHYVRLDRNSILAARVTGATSFGSERILYYLGGMENQLFSNFDDGIPVPDKNFAYQTLAAQMRGFQINARNGSSVVLANLELRVPFLKYLSKRKIKSSLFRNLQVVGFLDVGTAWHGASPFSDENPLNTVVLQNPPTVEVQVQYFRNPIIAGYGVGARTLLFGYFLKLDYAWGYDTRTVTEPMLHFSIGKDF